jgi:UDP-3-O-acyl N-acetylglucosamine deacetylase
MTRRRTLAAPVAVSGVGIHTGTHATVRVHPAAPGEGVVFDVTAPGSRGQIPASVARVADTRRCTMLADESGENAVLTVEHLLSAFAGLGVTDAVVEVTGAEMPIGDGSALFWADALRGAGFLDAPEDPAHSHRPEAVAPFALTAPVQVTGTNGAFAVAYPADRFRATVAAVFDHPLVGTQVARFDSATDDYAAAVAPARTFGFIEEVEALLAAGLARGGSFDNAVVVYPDRYSSELRFPDELARHKLLDLMGDLFLAGRGPLPPVEVFAVKPSHRLNVELAARLRG